MPRATRTFFRAAGGLMLASGLCIFGATGLCAQTSPQTKPKATTTTSKTSSSKKSTSKSGKRRSSTSRSRMQTAPTPDRIKEIQEALAKAGSYKGEPTGKWDDNTTEAMKHFQISNGLQPTGKLGALSLQKLGLGSESAGHGAPRPALPASNSTPSNNPRLP